MSQCKQTRKKKSSRINSKLCEDSLHWTTFVLPNSSYRSFFKSIASWWSATMANTLRAWPCFFSSAPAITVFGAISQPHATVAAVVFDHGYPTRYPAAARNFLPSLMTCLQPIQVDQFISDRLVNDTRGISDIGLPTTACPTGAHFYNFVGRRGIGLFRFVGAECGCSRVGFVPVRTCLRSHTTADLLTTPR